MPAYSFGPDTRGENHKKPVPNVRLLVWDGKRRTEPGAYKEWKREIKAIQLAYDIADVRYAPLLFLATKDDARDVLWDLDAEHLNSLDMIMTRLNKEYEKLDFEKSELAYQDFERCRRTPGQSMSAYLRDMDRTYTKMIKEDEGTRLYDVTLARRLLRRSGLNHDEQRHVLASCEHKYDLEKIRTALRLTYGDANRDDSKRRFSQAPAAASRRPGGHGGHGGAHKKQFARKFKRFGVNNADVLGDDDPHEEDSEQDDEDLRDDDEHADKSDEEGQQEGDEPPEDDDDDGSDFDAADEDQLWEIFYQGLKAGKKLKSASKGWKKPTGRGRGGPGRPSFKFLQRHARQEGEDGQVP